MWGEGGGKGIEEGGGQLGSRVVITWTVVWFSRVASKLVTVTLYARSGQRGRCARVGCDAFSDWPGCGWEAVGVGWGWGELTHTSTLERGWGWGRGLTAYASNRCFPL